jgi:hypothetical protein
MARTVLLRDDTGPHSAVFGRVVLQETQPAMPPVLTWRGDFFIPGGYQDGQETYRKCGHESLMDGAVTI